MLNLSKGAIPSELALTCGGKLIYEGNKPSTHAVIDSRNADKGSIFFAIKGERTDGHLYLSSAAEKGASAVITEILPDDISAFEKYGCSVILVDHSAEALAKLAKNHKSEMKALTVGVTGSVGKTTTRQYVASVLGTRFNTHKTEGNFNNELGLPLTVIGIREDHEMAVIEMGMGKKGDISFLSSIAMPDIGIITTIGSSHIEHLGSREGIRDAKLEIRDGLKKGGKLILNGDEPLLANIEDAIYVSLSNKDHPYRADNIITTDDGMRFDAHCPSRIIKECIIPTFGTHTVHDAMFAVAVGDIVGLTDEEIKLGLNSFEGVGMRQNIKVKNGITYIHDYYNASPESIRASLSVTKKLADSKNGRTVAVIGSVLELGEMSEALHRSIGNDAFSIGADLLFTFGEDAAFIADEALKLGMDDNRIFVFKDISDPNPIANVLRASLKTNDCVLIKASHGIEMGRIADLL
jgi:UDP-N-acetylmuramoyl-tripeptide--D-alanyl-D-alanine ligase